LAQENDLGANRKVLLIDERSLRLALSEYVAHYHAERNHQGKDNVLLFPRARRGGLCNIAKGWAEAS
jgi:hypothetical protein